MLAAATLAFSESADDKFLLEVRLDLQPIRGALVWQVNTGFALGDDTFQSLLFCELEKGFPTILNLSADLDAVFGSDYLLQPLPSLQDVLSSNVPAIGQSRSKRK
jgi:hypothetical protein